MLYGIIRWAIISLILIALIHHLFYFFKDTLTVPKVKDLIHVPRKQYEEIENTLKSSTENSSLTENTAKHRDAASVNQADMANELKSFFNELKTNQSFNLENNSFANNGIDVVY